MCLICEGRINKIGKVIECCALVRELPVIPGLKKIWCSGCTGLTEIPVIPDLEILICRGCTNLTKIPVIPGLKNLICRGCTALTEIPVIPGLRILACTDCPLLTEIPYILGLKELHCDNCISLLSIPYTKDRYNFRFLPERDRNNMNISCKSPFLSQNPNNKILQGIKLQKWIKNNFRYFVFQRWINSVEGKEWIYHPDNIGGRIEKSKMLKTLQSIN